MTSLTGGGGGAGARGAGAGRRSSDATRPCQLHGWPKSTHRHVARPNQKQALRALRAAERPKTSQSTACTRHAYIDMTHVAWHTRRTQHICHSEIIRRSAAYCIVYNVQRSNWSPFFLDIVATRGNALFSQSCHTPASEPGEPPQQRKQQAEHHTKTTKREPKDARILQAIV